MQPATKSSSTKVARVERVLIIWILMSHVMTNDTVWRHHNLVTKTADDNNAAVAAASTIIVADARQSRTCRIRQCVLGIRGCRSSWFSYPYPCRGSSSPYRSCILDPCTCLVAPLLLIVTADIEVQYVHMSDKQVGFVWSRGIITRWIIFFSKRSSTVSSLHHLLPHLRDTPIIFRLRFTAVYLRSTSCKNVPVICKFGLYK